MDVYHPISCSDEQENKMTLKVFKTWIEKHPFVLDSIFGHSCLKDKNLQYSRLGGDENRIGSLSSSVKKQTWVNSTMSTRHEKESCSAANGSSIDKTYAKADYLWSPVFAKMNSKPSKRCKLAACVVYDSLFVYGGRGICTSLKDMWRYDIGENTWFPVEERGDNRPSYLQEHSMLPYKNNLVVFGGEFTSLNETPLWFFDLHTSTWSKPFGKQKGPVNRRGHTAVITGDVMYVFGGYIDLRGASKELWKYDFSTNVWTRETVQSRWPSPRYSHSAVVFDRSMVIFGGLEDMQLKNDMWLWNMASCKWTRIKGKNSPPPLFGHTAVKVGDGMIIFGGESTDGSLHNTLWRFNFDSQSWTTITPKGMISPPPRSYHSLVQIPHFIFTSRRPTSSRSAPPPTPGYDRELPRLEEENEANEFTELDIGKTMSSVVSLGSLDSTALLSQTDDELVRIKVNTTGSLDSLIPNKSLREAENMSMTNHDRISDTNDEDDTLASEETTIGHNHSYTKHKSASIKKTNNLLKPTYGVVSLREQLKPQSTNYLSPSSKVPFCRSTLDDDAMQSAVINLMVLGGTSKRGIESVDRWIDMWKCQIDPEKQSSCVKRIEVQCTEPSQYNSARSYDSTVAYVNFNITDNANDNEYYDDSDENGDTTIKSECVLMDLSDGDTDALDKTLDQTTGQSNSMTTVSI